MREQSPAEKAAMDECLAAVAAGDVAGEEAAWRRLVKASGRKPRRFRWVVRPRLNGHDLRHGQGD